jgi:hypothetical protein
LLVPECASVAVVFVFPVFILLYKATSVADSYLDKAHGNSYYYWIMDYDTKTRSARKNTETLVKAYITLDSLLDLINNYIIIGAGTDKKLLPFTKLSTYSNTYETDTPEPLSCLSHPLQVSVDPDVCIITNNLFANGFDIKVQQADLGAANGTPGTYDAVATNVYKTISSFGVANPIGLNQKIKIAQIIWKI